MKSLKAFIKYSALLLVSGAFTSFFTSCEIGLGSALDLEAPVIKLTSHNDNDSVAQSFVLYGTAADNEDVKKISISFEDAGMYYQIVPGKTLWQKKNDNTSGQWVDISEDSNNFCTGKSGSWSWSLEIDTDDKTESKTDSTYTFTAVVSDKQGNTSKNSTVTCSLVLDTSNPNVSIYKPELFEGTYEAVQEKTKDYEKGDGNVISYLFNGDIELKGRISNSVSFKGLRIEFDDGQLNSGVRKVTGENSVTSIDNILNLSEADLGDETEPAVYFTETLTDSDLREWSVKVTPEQWATSENGIKNGLNTGKHLIRVVTTALSSSDAWERKIIGYFMWYPEADEPWITASVGDETYTTKDSVSSECYPGSYISGMAQDDDAIQSFKTTVYKASDSGSFTDTVYSATDYTNPVNYTVSSDSPKSLNWSFEIPSETGTYRLVLEVSDYTGNTITVNRYFKTSDVGAPLIKIISPEDESSAITNTSGNLTLNVKATDTNKLESFAFVWLNPAKNSDVSNKIKYLTGTDSNWGNASSSGWQDTSGNKIYKVSVESDGRTSILNKTFNLFTDFGIDGSDKQLISQNLIFRASDGENVTVKSLSLSGDTITPEITLKKIIINSVEESLLNNNIPSYESSASGKTAVISGTWSDSFTSELSNTDKIYSFALSWNGNTTEITPSKDGTWTASVTVPQGGGTITCSIQDYGGNKKTVQGAVNIETADLSLSRVGCLNDDGSYNAGKNIDITLNFSKKTDVVLSGENLPYLTLNNGGKAYFYKDSTSEYTETGSGTTEHVFRYTVGSSDTYTEKLDVSSLTANGALWYDSSVTGESRTSFTFDVSELSDNSKLGTTRTIKIDNEKPYVESVKPLSSSGYYKEGQTVIFLLTFNENVTIENASSLKLVFGHSVSSGNVTTDSASLSGSKAVIFTHIIAADENTSNLKLNSFTSDGVKVSDEAGNELTSWSVPSGTSLSSIKIDTTAPSAPSVVFFKGSTDEECTPSSIILDSAGISFTLTANESDVESMEYSLDAGVSWTPYSEKVTLTNNGDFRIISRATDKAGNRSETASLTPVSFTIDAGSLLTKISADTSSGSYSTNTSTKVIEGKIQFRKAVTIEKGAYITLNVANSTETPKVTSRKCYLAECKDSAGTSSTFTFEYTIKTGDYADVLDVTSWSFSSVTIYSSGKSAEIDFPDEETESAKLLRNNRTIKIDAICPVIQSCTLDGTDLTISFDSEVSKSAGELLISYDTSNNDFYAPAVLSSSDYSELEGEFASLDTPLTLSDYYEAGTNGATVSGTTLVNDTTAKYILKFTKSTSDSDLVAAFIAAGRHQVSVPVIAGSYKSSDKTKLIYDLSSTYALPVKGAVYSVAVPSGFATDSVSNPNAAKTYSITEKNVEKPEIRIKKPDYTLYNKSGSGKSEITADNWVSTASAYVDMSEVQYATMFITCRTPGATIMYTATAYDSTAVKITNSRPVDESKVTVTVSVPSSASTEYTSENETSGVSLGKAISSYDTATGLKYAIASQGTKNGFTSSELSYEYATRSVVKLLITGNYRAGEDAYDKTPFDKLIETNYDESTALKLHDYRPWIMGGDSPSGANSIDTFPLSWSETGKYRFMAGDYNSTTNKYGYTATNNMYGKWYWVSWNIPSTTYIGFMVGDVPSDAVSNGPSHWVPADYHWVPMKQKYPLYPGEELIMAQESASVTPMSASLAFGIKKSGSR